MSKKKGPKAVLGQLWGSGKGKFRTSGKYSSATVRGTIWLVQDRCEGTLTKVSRGTVQVADFQRHKTVSVKAGHSYLARAAARGEQESAEASDARGAATPRCGVGAAWAALVGAGLLAVGASPASAAVHADAADAPTVMPASRSTAGRSSCPARDPSDASSPARASVIFARGRPRPRTRRREPGTRPARLVPFPLDGAALHRDVDRRRDTGRRPRSAGRLPGQRRRRPRARRARMPRAPRRPAT